MKRNAAVLAVMLVLCTGSVVWAANSIVVAPTTLATNGDNCDIRVRLENDIPWNGIQVPLVIREVTSGAFITEMQIVFDDRLGPGGHLTDIQFRQHFAEPDGTCKPGGFGAATYTDGLPHPVVASPEGALFVAVAIAPYFNLPPGTDGTGSLVLRVDVAGTPGSFEIDTTCMDPATHLLVVDEYGLAVPTTFIKGIVAIIDNNPPVMVCSNANVPADEFCLGAASIDAGTYDPEGDPLAITQRPLGPYPLGETEVWLIASDSYCHTDSCSAIVRVIDVTPPVITCNRDTTVLIAPTETGTIVEFESSAIDNCSLYDFSCAPPSGSFFPIGTTTVTCTAVDDYLNDSQCTFEVTVTRQLCNDRPEDVNCDGVVDVLDVVKTVNVAFRGGTESSRCCNPATETGP